MIELKEFNDTYMLWERKLMLEVKVTPWGGGVVVVLVDGEG
jgi:hypothetical protein